MMHIKNLLKQKNNNGMPLAQNQVHGGTGTHAAPFPPKLFKRELAKLRLPKQALSFVTHNVALEADPTLASALAAATGAAVVPTLRVGGRFVPTKRLVLDSQRMRAALMRLGSKHFGLGGDGARSGFSRGRSAADGEGDENTDGFHGFTGEPHDGGDAEEPQHWYAGDAGGGDADAAVRHVPVFVFMNDGALPLFIDKYLTAKAVGGMVLVTQSRMRDWESHIACNGRPVHWDLRSPLRAAIAATIEEIGGIGASHVSYSEAHGRNVDNWMWSVGETPLSATSSRFNVSMFQRDAVHRNYIVAAAYRMHVRVTRALASLEAQRTTSDNFAAIPEIPFKDIRREFWSVDDLARDMIREAGDLDFAAAVELIEPLEAAVSSFEALVKRCAAAMAAHRCPPPKRDSRSMAVIWVISAVFALGGAGLAYRSRDRKFKVN
jgi:hypothetical protein